ncbi:MAG: pseudouridine-5'-phosphate glycosidase [Bacilli bacterium]|nr:pseudouridine-5'-phosphate glycosidase [Bacilli bacterium]
MKINPIVQQAILNNQPVVALESTIISHGMPYPKNVETALRVEQMIKDHGAIPATIGIIDGEPVVGMTPEEIEEFGKRKGILKASRRDLPVIYAKKLWAATTVASTMIIANQAGIEVFVTGGIGGVHRGAQETMDISADLQELAKTNVTVICAGAKAILDLPLTLEYLETMGVPVLGFQTSELPAFYTSHSGLKVDYAIDNYQEAAQIILEKRKNNLAGGILITNPIPDQYAMDSKVINEAIEKALKMANEQGIKGKDTTPFLLKTIVELTGGDSLESNIHLVLNNAAVGAEISKEVCKQK